MNTRKEGYYWVKYCGKWHIAKCNPEYYWQIVSLDDSIANLNNLDYESDEFEEINETRIPAPDEPIDVVFGQDVKFRANGEIFTVKLVK